MAGSEFAAAVLAGLSQKQKRIEAKYFYDEEGSRLFDRICELEEYYPTRTEIGILREHAGELSRVLPENTALIELGSGASVKTRLLLDAVAEISTYVPLDISGEHLKAAADRIAAAYPKLRVLPLVADFTRDIALPPELTSVPKALFFPGSTIGNFTPPDAQTLLARLGHIPKVEVLVIGVDLVKDIDLLIAAYDDAEGVTAAFNKNLLHRLNGELGATFDIDAFAHGARWNAKQSRIEMHLVSRRRQSAEVAGRTFSFAKGETIHTENSHKFTFEQFGALADAAGWRVRDVWVDDASLFSVQLFLPH